MSIYKPALKSTNPIKTFDDKSYVNWKSQFKKNCNINILPTNIQYGNLGNAVVYNMGSGYSLQTSLVVDSPTLEDGVVAEYKPLFGLSKESINIVNGGSGYVVGDKFIIYSNDEDDVPGVIQITSVDTNGSILDFSIHDFGLYTTNNIAEIIFSYKDTVFDFINRIDNIGTPFVEAIIQFVPDKYSIVGASIVERGSGYQTHSEDWKHCKIYGINAVDSNGAGFYGVSYVAPAINFSVSEKQSDRLLARPFINTTSDPVYENAPGLDIFDIEESPATVIKTDTTSQGLSYAGTYNLKTKTWSVLTTNESSSESSEECQLVTPTDGYMTVLAETGTPTVILGSTLLRESKNLLLLRRAQEQYRNILVSVMKNADHYYSQVLKEMLENKAAQLAGQLVLDINPTQEVYERLIKKTRENIRNAAKKGGLSALIELARQNGGRPVSIFDKASMYIEKRVGVKVSTMTMTHGMKLSVMNRLKLGSEKSIQRDLKFIADLLKRGETQASALSSSLARRTTLYKFLTEQVLGHRRTTIISATIQQAIEEAIQEALRESSHMPTLDGTRRPPRRSGTGQSKGTNRAVKTRRGKPKGVGGSAAVAAVCLAASAAAAYALYRVLTGEDPDAENTDQSNRTVAASIGAAGIQTLEVALDVLYAADPLFGPGGAFSSTELADATFEQDFRIADEMIENYLMGVINEEDMRTFIEKRSTNNGDSIRISIETLFDQADVDMPVETTQDIIDALNFTKQEFDRVVADQTPNLAFQRKFWGYMTIEEQIDCLEPIITDTDSTCVTDEELFCPSSNNVSPDKQNALPLSIEMPIDLLEQAYPDNGIFKSNSTTTRCY